ncbi:MAG: hypothetical protein ACRD6R_12940 [Candidatus Polarisedimenticolia bacterium]
MKAIISAEALCWEMMLPNLHPMRSPLSCWSQTLGAGGWAEMEVTKEKLVSSASADADKTGNERGEVGRDIGVLL